MGNSLSSNRDAAAGGGGDPIDEFFDPSTWIAAVAGALVILFIWNAINERRIA